MRNSPTCKVAILYPVSVPWMARCLDGIRRYASHQGGWHIFSSPPTLRGAEESALTLASMRGWKGDAILVASNNERELREAEKMRIPVVNLGGGLPEHCGVPRVMVNHVQAGRLAAEHLLNRGLKDLAFFGWTGLWYSEQRQRGFLEVATEAGAKCEILLRDPKEESAQIWTERIKVVARWIASLPRPTGVFAVQDYRAQQIVEAAQEAELRIPEDIAVIGMDNDVTICEHSHPTISSISRNSVQVGWEAAALLDRMMHGDRPPAADILLEPDGVIARQSTDLLYSSDSAVQRALGYMRDKLDEQFDVGRLAEHLGISKRTLETRFRKNLRTSPHGFLMKLRVEKARTQMKISRKCTVEQIALESGFASVQAFRKAFERVTGESLAAFRKKQLGANPAIPGDPFGRFGRD